uniref:Uncharacterized protein LOC105630727 isoform X3 n=1 Tax=Rhizophora mucronata TaxID=61149 RepID=A0A2P2JDF9_RHIMU
MYRAIVKPALQAELCCTVPDPTQECHCPTGIRGSDLNPREGMVKEEIAHKLTSALTTSRQEMKQLQKKFSVNEAWIY